MCWRREVVGWRMKERKEEGRRIKYRGLMLSVKGGKISKLGSEGASAVKTKLSRVGVNAVVG